jgi:hypothetical protein
MDLDQLLREAKLEAHLRAQAQKAKVSVQVEKIPVPQVDHYKWSTGPIIALMANGQFLGMFREMTCERLHARRLTHLPPEEEADAIPSIVETIPQWKEPAQITQELTIEVEAIKPLPPAIELIRDVTQRNKRLGFRPGPDVEAMLAELGLREWE